MNKNLKKTLISNLVPILMLTLIIIAFPLSGLGFVSTIQEIVQRFSRNL